MTARNVFDATREVGARAEPTPVRPPFRCVAHDCPMPGVIFPSGSRDGICGWHYGAMPGDFPRITRLLRDWACVTDEILQARRTLCDPATCMSLRVPLERAWERLAPAVYGTRWYDELRPHDGEWLNHWCDRLMAFVSARIAQDVHPRNAHVV